MNGENDYNWDLTNSDEMKFLTETNHLRIEEERTRPRVEIWPDDEWQLWIARHEQGKHNVLCHVQAMRATPFCAIGYH